MEPRPQKLIAGKYRIPEPCAMSPEEMTTVDGCRRFCTHCNQHVHDLTGKSPMAIQRLFEAHKGELCASFEMDEKGEPIVGEDLRPSKVRFLKHWAAAASFFLIYQIPFASRPQVGPSAPSTNYWNINISNPSARPFPGGGNPTNTLVTAVIVDLDGNAIRHDLQVGIWVNGDKVAETIAEAGLIFADLEGVAEPTDTIEIRVRGEHIHSARGEYIYDDARLTAQLANAQNLQIAVDERFRYHGRRRKNSRIMGKMKF